MISQPFSSGRVCRSSVAHTATEERLAAGQFAGLSGFTLAHFHVRIISFHATAKQNRPLCRRFYFGTPEMIRTSDARFRKPTLYPLSYGGILFIARK